jgi:hypothetical protein
MKTILEQLLALQQVEFGPAPDAPENQKIIQRLRKTLPEPILGHYDRLRVRGKTGVSIVRHGVCTGCHMRLATGVYAELFHVDDVRICDNCGRYLMLAEEDRQAEAAQRPVEPPPVKEKKPGRKRRTPAELQAA